MPFFIATRTGNEITVQFHVFMDREKAVEEAGAFVESNGFRREDVMVVIADSDVHALKIAKTNFSRR